MRSIATIAATIALLLPGSALARSSTCQAYNPQLCGTGAGTGSAGTEATAAANRSASGPNGLPFTGLDLLLLAAGGGFLIATGLAVRRLTRQLDPPDPPL